jgi:hypothetical protein
MIKLKEKQKDKEKASGYLHTPTRSGYFRDTLQNTLRSTAHNLTRWNDLWIAVDTLDRKTKTDGRGVIRLCLPLTGAFF